MAEAALADTGKVDGGAVADKVVDKGAGGDKAAADVSRETSTSAKAGGTKTALAGDDTQQVADKGSDATKGAKQIAVEAKWADDWRDRMANGNEKLGKRLARYASPEAVAAGLETLLTRMEAGEFKKPLAKDATEDDIKKFRADNGIPESPDKYEMPDGLQISEIDKPIIDKFLTFAHGQNKTPDDVKGIINWFYQAQEEQKNQMYEADQQFHDEAVGVLKAELGQDYNRYINGLKSFVTTQFGEKMFSNIMGARLGDGTLAGDNPDFLKGWIKIMNEVNPAATLTTGGGINPLTDIDSEINKLETMMRTDRAGYDRDPKNAQRALELYEAREKLKARAA